MNIEKTVSNIETNLQVLYSGIRIGLNLDVVTPKDVLFRIINKQCNGSLADVQVVRSAIDADNSVKNLLLRNLDSLIQEDKKSQRENLTQVKGQSTSRGFASLLVSLVTKEVDPLVSLVASNLEAIESVILTSMSENPIIHKDVTRGGHTLLALMQVLNPNHQYNSKFSFDSVLDRVTLPQGTTKASVRDVVSKIFNSTYDALVSKFVSTQLYKFISESLMKNPDATWGTISNNFVAANDGLQTSLKQSICNSLGKEYYDCVRVSVNTLHLYDSCYQDNYIPVETYHVSCSELFKNKDVFTAYLSDNSGVIKTTMTEIASNHRHGRPLKDLSLFIRAVSDLEDNPSLFESRTIIASYVKKMSFDAVSLTVG